MVTSNFA